MPLSAEQKYRTICSVVQESKGFPSLEVVVKGIETCNPLAIYRPTWFSYGLVGISRVYCTCSLLVSHLYLALDGICNPLRTAIPNISSLKGNRKLDIFEEIKFFLHNICGKELQNWVRHSPLHQPATRSTSSFSFDDLVLS